MARMNSGRAGVVVWEKGIGAESAPLVWELWFSSGMMLRAGRKCMRWRGRGRGRPRFLVALSLSLRRLFFSTLFSRGPNSHVFRRRSVPLSRLGWRGREEEESFRRLLRNREIDQGEDDTQVEIRPLKVPHKKRTFTSFQKLIHLYGLRWGGNSVDGESPILTASSHPPFLHSPVCVSYASYVRTSMQGEAEEKV